MTHRRTRLCAICTVHPHRREERKGANRQDGAANGSSPLAWGISGIRFSHQNNVRFIPTDVRNIPFHHRIGGHQPVHSHGCEEVQTVLFQRASALRSKEVQSYLFQRTRSKLAGFEVNRNVRIKNGFRINRRAFAEYPRFISVVKSGKCP